MAVGSIPRQLPVTVALVAVLVFAAPASGAQTTVVVTASGGLAGLSGVRLVTLGADGVPRRVAGNVINLDPEIVVTCVGDDVWCPRIHLDDPDVERIILPAYPRTLISVVLELPFGEKIWANELVQVEGWLYEDDQTEAMLLFTEGASVAVIGGRVEASWSGPRGVLDLRLTAAGWMPHYWFDVEANSGVVALGEARMNRGASVSVFAVEMETGLPLVGATASLEAPQDLLDDQRSERLRVSGTTNERGFIQLRDVEPGGYNLILEAEGRPPVRLSGVEMEEGQETWLGDVQVPGYSQLTIHVDPPSDGGAPWQINLERLLPPWDTTKGTTDGFGVLVQRELVPGPYLVKVYDVQGNQLSSEERSVEGDGQVPVTIRLSRVRGRVLLGRDGVQATVELSTGAGAWTTFETDDEGRFEGRVPAPTEDEFIAFVDTETINRELEVQPILREGVYEVTLQLGAFEISGLILDRETGFPLEGASVELVRPTETESGPTLGTADLDGQFLFQGLDDEPHVVSAYLDGYSRSQQVEVRPSEMSEDDDADAAVTLFLREGTEVDVVVTSENGTPQRGAYLWVLTLTSDGVGVGASVTNLSGQGRLVVPRSVTPAAVVVRAPTGVLWSGCVPIPEEGSDMEIRVPSGPGGTLLVTPSGQPKTVTMPEQALVSIDGGLLTLQALGMWMNDQGVPFTADGMLTVPRVASNHYGVADVSGLGLAAYPAACQGVIRPLAPWEFLVEGGELELPMRFSIDDEVLFWNLP